MTWDAKEIGGLAAIIALIGLIVIDVIHIEGTINDWHLYVLSALIASLLGVDFVAKGKHTRIASSVLHGIIKGADHYQDDDDDDT